jgi:nitric oxide synthase oxygenase domain/subunit
MTWGHDLTLDDQSWHDEGLGDLGLFTVVPDQDDGAAARDAGPARPAAPHPVFRSTRALLHDVQRSRIDADRVAAEWALMYRWLRHDEEMTAVCGFTPADVTTTAEARRIGLLRREIGMSGRTFTVLPQEMQFWVRFSWTAADRCSGRQHALQHAVIRYRPDVVTARGMLAAAVEHADVAMSAPLPPQTVVTVLGPPTPPGRLGQMFATEQLLRPAAYRRDDGSWVGDGGYLELTDWVADTGVELIDPAPGYPPGAFDALPMVAMGRDGELAIATPPPASRYLVDIPWPRHPDADEAATPRAEPFACWPALPLQTNFDLDIAGQRYCVIFNGWYVDEEIGASLLDPGRYGWVDRVSAAIHSEAELERLRSRDRFDEYRLAQVEIATLRAIRTGFKTARRKLNNLGPSQSGFGKFYERFLAAHGEPPPNDTGWTANRFGSRYRHPSHAMPHVRQRHGAQLVKHWLTFRSLRPAVPLEIVNLATGAGGASSPSRPPPAPPGGTAAPT